MYNQYTKEQQLHQKNAVLYVPRHVDFDHLIFKVC